MLRDQLIMVVLCIEIEQMVLLAQDFTTLVEFTHTDAHVIQFSIVGCIDNLLLGELDVVDLTESRQETDDHGCAGGETTNGQGALDYSAETYAQSMLP